MKILRRLSSTTQKKIRWLTQGLVGLALMGLSPAQAKIFSNAYVSFQLPEKWSCVLETTEWVCRSSDSRTAREAIIILTAKERGPNDEMHLYEAHLRKTKTILDRGGQNLQSKIIDVKVSQINGQNWIDALHLNSEVPGFYTRYAATIKDRLGILVTFSAHQLAYTKYSTDFFNAIKSLRAIAQRPPAGGDSGGQGMLGSGTELLGAGQLGGIPADLGADLPAEQSSSNTSLYLGLGVLVAAVAGYIILKTRRPRPTRGKTQPPEQRKR